MGSAGHGQDHAGAGSWALPLLRSSRSFPAVTAGVKDVRAVIERARDRLGVHGTGTILFLDEVHRFNKA